MFFRILSLISLILSVLIIFCISWLRTSLPITAGTVLVTGISAQVTIKRDLHGIPHIQGTIEPDVYFGLGYAHAQDRLWQMELSRRAGAGRLSEIFGERTLNADKYLRGLGIYESAEASLSSFSPDSLVLLQSYSDGINAYLSSHKGSLPLEFIFFGHKPEAWRPADSVACAKMMAHQLSGNAADELLRHRLLETLSIRQVNELWGIGPSTEEIKDRALIEYPLALTDEFLSPGSRHMVGSNNWVIDGRHTAHKMPILASDPHLGLTAPSPWYLTHLSGSSFDVAGGTLPGIPVIIIGRNRSMAWGVTNTGPDVQDLFIEKVANPNSEYYVTEFGRSKFQKRKEIIKIKGKDDFQYTIRMTQNGPVISDFSDRYNIDLTSDTVVSFSWTALTKNDTTLEAGFNLAKAKSWKDFTDALSTFVAPQQNFIAAHVNGDIGFIAPGKIPIRRKGTGWLPTAGWTGEGTWIGEIPLNQLPQNLNPEEGSIITANQDITTDGYPYFLSHDWAASYRFDRIKELLADPNNHSINGFKGIQTDIVSHMAMDFKKWILSTKIEQSLLKNLEEWDGTMASDAIEPLIFHAWYRELTKLVYSDELGPNFTHAWERRPKFLKLTLTHDSKWCDDITTVPIEDCEEIIQLAGTHAVKWLKDNYGPNPKNWKWENAHIARHKHSTFSGIPILGDFFDIKHIHSGGPYTVMQANTTLREDKAPFEENHGAALRAIFDLSMLDHTHVMISTGQSGNRLSKNYSSLSHLWSTGNYVSLPISQKGVEKVATAELLLIPDH